jgi:fucose 4-O-acetylase-like acetyltransferase
MKKQSTVFATIQQNLQAQKFFVQSEQMMQGKRVLALDVLKGLLILRMVFAHARLRFNLDMSWLASSEWIFQVTVFSGLFFAFGYGTYKAYLEKGEPPRRHIIYNIIKILLAYVLCGFVYGVFQLHVLSLQFMISLVRLDFLFYGSEFLLTYVIVLILLLIVPNFFRVVTRKDAIFWPVIAGLLFTTLIDYSQIKSISLGVLIGTETASSFPVVQYLPLYLLGIYLAQRRNHFSKFIFAGSIVSIIVLFIAHKNGLVGRFPPTFYWIFGSLGMSYLLFLFSHFIARVNFLQKPLADVGRHALYWLVMSNLIIYTMSNTLSKIVLPSYWVAIIIFGIYFSIAFLNNLAKNNKTVIIKEQE